MKKIDKFAMEPTKPVKKMTTNEKYLKSMFDLLKKRDNLALSDKKMRFNDTELRMISEILNANAEGKRLISTQIAKNLGVTRSAVSQIVNRLEEQGVVKRIGAGDIDKKIAYIEVTDEIMLQYQDEVKACADFAGVVVKKYGADRFSALCREFDAFLSALNQVKDEYESK